MDTDIILIFLPVITLKKITALIASLLERRSCRRERNPRVVVVNVQNQSQTGSTG